MPSSVLLTWDAHRRRDLEPAQRPIFGLVQGAFQVCVQPPHDGICNSAKVPQVHGLRRELASAHPAIPTRNRHWRRMRCSQRWDGLSGR